MADDVARITDALQSAVDQGVFPGAVLMVRLRGRLVYQRACGFAAILPEREPVSLQTVYDLASLTKPLATATAILYLMQRKSLDLSDPVERFLDELKGSPAGNATIFHLLNHSSGLPAWRSFYEPILQSRSGRGFVTREDAQRVLLDRIREEAMEYPIGTRSVYSDLGFMLLGIVVERLTGSSLSTFCRDAVYRPNGAEPLFFCASNHTMREATGYDGPPLQIAPTENDPLRGRILRGQVHDENAYALDGVAGHAGLFGTASAVLTVGGLWLDGYLSRNTFLAPDLVRRFVSRQATPGSSWALGWDTPSSPSSSGGYFSDRSFGHLGFTGTSIWMDPDPELEIVLLSNRIHPTRQNTAIQAFRPLIHNIIYEEFVGGR